MSDRSFYEQLGAKDTNLTQSDWQDVVELVGSEIVDGEFAFLRAQHPSFDCGFGIDFAQHFWGDRRLTNDQYFSAYTLVSKSRDYHKGNYRRYNPHEEERDGIFFAALCCWNLSLIIGTESREKSYELVQKIFTPLLVKHVQKGHVQKACRNVASLSSPYRKSILRSANFW